jgi:beta-galactosidase GanA
MKKEEYTLNNNFYFSRIFYLALFVLFFSHFSLFSQENAAIPYLKNGVNNTELIVDGKPFLMLAGELHNSSSSTPEYFADAMLKAKTLHINTLIASISWEQFEPEQGQFDYTLIDAIIKKGTENNLKLVIIWFGSWKNGESSYAPLWVKKDTEKYFRVKTKEGKNTTTISPFSKDAMLADANAFSVLMKRIKEKDLNKTVLMIQPENEVGAFQDIDHNEIALSLFKSKVPVQLLKYLVENKNKLEKEIQSAWDTNGNKEKGNWSEVFGGQNLDAQNFFMTWQYASYINEVCRQGKKTYNLPMYVNCWLVQNPEELPGSYPNGGPVSRVIDIYHAAAPDIDFVAPDIYLPNYKEVLSMYHLPNKHNPLFIPECERTNPGKAYYAFAEHDALGFGPFGIESVASDISYAQSYAVLNEILPTITKYRSTGKMRGILKEENQETDTLIMGKYKVNIQYEGKNSNAYGLIIQTSEDEFLVAGINLKISFSSLDKETKACIGQVLEGELNGEKWNTYRWLNGDETWHNSFLFTAGRSYTVKRENEKISVKQALAPIPVLNQTLEKSLQVEQVKAPGIYKVNLYQHKW